MLARHIAQDKPVLAYPASWGTAISPSITIEELNQLPSVRLPRSVDPYYYDWQEMLFHHIRLDTKRHSMGTTAKAQC
ncbi:hypothetical protein P4S72_27900 [Vibrio sp. PP-XX7]